MFSIHGHESECSTKMYAFDSEFGGQKYAYKHARKYPGIREIAMSKVKA
jgi:hypothetical protein